MTRHNYILAIGEALTSTSWGIVLPAFALGMALQQIVGLGMDATFAVVVVAMLVSLFLN